MITVYSKEEFKSAVKAGEKKIIVKGAFAEEIRQKASRQRKVKKGAKIAGAAALIGGIALMPFTGGASAAGAVAGATALTVGTLTISTAELAIIVGGGVIMTAMIKGYDKITVNRDGSVVLEKK